MNDLTAVIDDLTKLVVAYDRRVLANGDGHPDNAYLKAQADRFFEAACALSDTIVAAEARSWAAAAAA